MKKLLICLLASLTFMACSDDDTAPVVTPTERGTVTDNEGNVYNWVRIGDQDWTTTNAHNGEPFYNLTYYNEYLEWEDYIFEFSSTRKRLRDKYVPVYGNLMKYEEAVASAPEGWRLPTDEDWKKLERTLGMCGEAASDPMMIPLLLAFGLNEFSMSPSAILRARKMVTQYDTRELQAVADKAMSFATTAEVENYMREFINQ